MAASSQPLATLAGIDVLRAGGNAADAAVAVAAALQVTQPCSTGLGGDAFCLYYDAATRRVRALNGSGRSPAALTLDVGRSAAGPGAARLPDQHPHSVTVPGAPAAWEDVVTTLGRLPMPAVLAPAIRLAEEGFPVAPCAARWWQGGAEHQLRRHRHGHELMIAGRGPRAGEVIRLPTLASSLRTLAEEGSAPFYRGRIAERIVAALGEEGGVMSPADLAGHRSQWVDPISIDYRGLRVWECPPNGQGLAVLLALNVVAQFDLADFPPGTFRRYHLLIEAMRLAFADAAWAVADPDFATIPLAERLSADYAAQRAAGIDLSRANRAPAAGMSPRRGPPAAPPHAGTDTVYFCTGDGPDDLTLATLATGSDSTGMVMVDGHLFWDQEAGRYNIAAYIDPTKLICVHEPNGDEITAGSKHIKGFNYWDDAAKVYNPFIPFPDGDDTWIEVDAANGLIKHKPPGPQAYAWSNACSITAGSLDEKGHVRWLTYLEFSGGQMNQHTVGPCAP
jgi:gamma-glutamyltranspeptidase/glutathione hydrolase